jgi:tyrosinase
MTAIRRNILEPGVGHRFAEAVLALKHEHLGPTTAQIGIPGPTEPVSTYDLFVVWHQLAMMRATPPTQSDRNAAHSGPVFLPWHRLMLLLLELHMQRVLGDDELGLPYWDWAVAGEDQTSPLWSSEGVGGTGDPVPDGPFGEAGPFRVRIESNALAQLRTTDRPLRRDLAGHPAARSLPTAEDVKAALDEQVYDGAEWDRASGGLRCRLEGWNPPLGLHNRVHVWVGGDMLPATSPNDPVFYLNHCNVDRIWEAWQERHGRTYLPDDAAATNLLGHRLSDPMYSILLAEQVAPADVLDIGSSYTYDALP